MFKNSKEQLAENNYSIVFIKFIVLLLVGLCGLLNLNEMFNGDQALFTVYASEMNQGAILYRDIWDIKQPAIFVFFLIGGKLFGFTEFGIHLFELIYWLIFSIVLQSTLKKYYRNEIFAQLTPLLTVGIYYAVCRNWHLTQVEGLASFPLYLTLWASAESFWTESKNQSRFILGLLSGFFGGAVLAFKLAFLPLLIIFWLMSISLFFNKGRNSLSEIFRLVIAPIFLGAIILPTIILIYFAWHNALPVILYTFFQYPSQAVVEVIYEDRFDVLKNGLSWFVLNFKTLILILAIGIYLKIIAEYKQFFGYFSTIAKISLFDFGLMAWLIIGFGIILFQRLSWWEYHYLLLFVPLGILGTKSLEIIWETAKSYGKYFEKSYGKAILLCAILVLFLPHLKQIIRKTKSNLEAFSATSDVKFDNSDFTEKYEAIRDETKFLAEMKDPDEKIFVIGQPLYYFHSKRPPAISSNGWMTRFFLPKQWQQLITELKETKPKYIFIELNVYEETLSKSAEIAQLLQENYRLRSRNKNSVCYEIILKTVEF
jgi:hypothetical protein